MRKDTCLFSGSPAPSVAPPPEMQTMKYTTRGTRVKKIGKLQISFFFFAYHAKPNEEHLTEVGKRRILTHSVISALGIEEINLK